MWVNFSPGLRSSWQRKVPLRLEMQYRHCVEHGNSKTKLESLKELLPENSLPYLAIARWGPLAYDVFNCPQVGTGQVANATLGVADGVGFIGKRQNVGAGDGPIEQRQQSFLQTHKRAIAPGETPRGEDAGIGGLEKRAVFEAIAEGIAIWPTRVHALKTVGVPVAGCVDVWTVAPQVRQHVRTNKGSKPKSAENKQKIH